MEGEEMSFGSVIIDPIGILLLLTGYCIQYG